MDGAKKYTPLARSVALHSLIKKLTAAKRRCGGCYELLKVKDLSDLSLKHQGLFAGFGTTETVSLR